MEIFTILNLKKTQGIYSEPNDETLWKNEWGGDIPFSHGTNRKGGVCILINPTINISNWNTPLMIPKDVRKC